MMEKTENLVLFPYSFGHNHAFNNLAIIWFPPNEKENNSAH